MKNVLLILFTFLFCAHSHASPKIGPSFNCEKASTKVEVEICSNPFLSFLDLYLSDIYKLALEKDPENNEKLKSEQRKWLKNARNNLCLQDDFSWSELAKEHGIDSVSTTNLEKCYVLRAAELNLLPCDEEALCNKYKEILSKVSTIPELMSTIGSSDADFFRNYGNKFNLSNSLDPAEKYIIDKYSESVIADLFTKCYSARPSIYYRDDNFFIAQHWGSTTCGGTSQMSNQKENLCIQGGSVVSVDNYWQCKGKNNVKSILQALTPIITTTNFSEVIENFSSYDSQSASRSTPESYLISTITSLPFLTYNHPSLYSKETMDWIDSNHNLILAVLGDYKENALTILRDAKYMYASIAKEENWQQKLTTIVENQERRFLGFDVDDKRIMNSHVVGTIYTLHDAYVLVWARIYKYGDMKKTIDTIEKLIHAIESVETKSSAESTS